MHFLTLSTLLFLAEYTQVSQAQPQCYFPDSTHTTSYAPCPGVTDSDPGACCFIGDPTWQYTDTCMSNNLCWSADKGFVYRGACTDQEWKSGGCPRLCADQHKDASMPLSPCSGFTMCCGSADETATQNCCENGGSDFWWNTATFIGPLNASTLVNVTGASGVIQGAGKATTTATVTNTAAAKSTSVKGIAIGLGVGLGVPLIIAIVTIIWLLLALADSKRRTTPPNQQQQTTWSEVASRKNMNFGFARNKVPHELDAQRDPAELDRYGTARGQALGQK